MSRRSDHLWLLVNLGLLLPFMACGLSGYNGSAPTLALENSASTDRAGSTSAQIGGGSSETETAATDAEASADPPADIPPASDPDWTPLLKRVDPADLLGSWQDTFFGTRTLTLNADGTAQMRLNFDLAGRFLYGQQLDFDMKWRLEEAVVKIDIIAGKPADPAKSLVDDWGTHHIYLLDRVEPDVVEMRDPEHTLKHTLRRIR